MTITVQTNYRVIKEHIAMVQTLAKNAGVQGKLVLAAFGEGLTPRVHHIALIDGDIGAALDFVADYEAEPYNFYMPLAIMKSDLPLGKKGGEDDVVMVLGAVVDDVGTKVSPRPFPADYIVESSAGNQQHFFFFKRPLPPFDAKPLLQALHRATGADCAFDMSHVWRIPGGLNYPNAKKIRDGRPADPQLVSVEREWDGISFTPVEMLHKELAAYREEPRRECTTTAPALDGYAIDEVRTWIDQKIPDWKEDPDSPWNNQGEWIFFGKALKLHFPNQDGLELFMLATHDGHKLAEKRWWDGRDFKPEWYEGARTLRWYLDQDLAWMFRNALAGNVVAVPCLSPEELAQMPQPGPCDDPEPARGVKPDDLIAYLPEHKYFFKPTRELWPASSVNSAVPSVLLFDRDGKPIMLKDKEGKETNEQETMRPSAWLDIHQACHQVGWAPGEPMEVRDRLLIEGAWVPRDGAVMFNLYRPPMIEHREGDPTPWLDLLKYIYPEEWPHILKWLAQRVQQPHIKVNHALVLGGPLGIGKDTLLQPVVQAVGPWNCKEVKPKQVLGDFNGHLKSVILRVSEAHDQGDIDRFKFHDAMLTALASPPDHHTINEKYLRHQAALNRCGVIYTTNHRTNCLYLTPDDRRHFVAFSARTKEQFSADYFPKLYGWFENGGNEIVAHYLATLPLEGFDPKAPPPKTEAFWAIVGAGRASEFGELSDVLNGMEWPAAVSLNQIRARATGDFGMWLSERRNRKAIPHKLEECGYIAVRNPHDTHGGEWRVAKPGGGHDRLSIYARKELELRAQLDAAMELIKRYTPER